MTKHLTYLTELGTIGKGSNRRIDYIQMSIRMSTDSDSHLHMESGSFSAPFMEGFFQTLAWIVETPRQAWEIYETYQLADMELAAGPEKVKMSLTERKRQLGTRNACAYALNWIPKPTRERYQHEPKERDNKKEADDGQAKVHNKGNPKTPRIKPLPSKLPRSDDKHKRGGKRSGDRTGVVDREEPNILRDSPAQGGQGDSGLLPHTEETK